MTDPAPVPERDKEHFARGIILFTDHALVARAKIARRKLCVHENVGRAA